MADQLTIAALCGSTRTESVNNRLLGLALDHVATDGDVTVDRIDLVDYPFPIYNQDLQDADGLPDGCQGLFDRFAGADAVLIASPEYNGGYTALLKNTIDWVTRIDMFLFAPRYMGLMSASPGGTGGARALAHTDQLFSNMFLTTHSPGFGLAKAHDAFAAGVDGLGEWVDGYVAGARAYKIEQAAKAAAEAKAD